MVYWLWKWISSVHAPAGYITQLVIEANLCDWLWLRWYLVSMLQCSLSCKISFWVGRRRNTALKVYALLDNFVTVFYIKQLTVCKSVYVTTSMPQTVCSVCGVILGRGMGDSQGTDVPILLTLAAVSLLLHCVRNLKRFLKEIYQM